MHILETRLTLAVLGIAIMVIGVMGLVANFSHTEIVGIWGGDHMIAVPASVGFLFTGLGFVVIAYRERYWEGHD